MLALFVYAGSTAAQEFFESPLQPPDTSSPRATLQSFLDNVRDAYDILMPAYAAYLAAPGLFLSESAREAEARANELLERAVRTLNLSEIPPALRQKVGLDRPLLLKEVLDRIPLPPFEAIPGPMATTAGAGEVPQATENEEAGARAHAEIDPWTVPYTEIAIARVEEGPQKGDRFIFRPRLRMLTTEPQD